ncbi:MAG: phospholipase D-like domain-containing protein [Bacteroidota bacterium]
MAGILDFGTTQIGLAGIGLVALYVAGALTALDAIMKERTPQGATAWVFALATLPLLALPLYWVLGRSRFDDYVTAVEQFDSETATGLTSATEGPLQPFLVSRSRQVNGREAGEMRAFDAMATLPFTHGNALQLLVDGSATFDALFEAIDAAESYVLAQYFIIHDDDIGRKFKRHLIDAAERGVTVRLLYDSVGSWRLSRRYKRDLMRAGVHVRAFTGPRNWLKKLRLNFRNHRKIVVCDGRVGFIGGLNVGDEYLGRDESFGPWRDTHLRVEGPTVQGLQLSFARDWFYATQDLLDTLTWKPTPASSSPGMDGEGQTALVLASGYPTDWKPAVSSSRMSSRVPRSVSGLPARTSCRMDACLALFSSLRCAAWMSGF